MSTKIMLEVARHSTAKGNAKLVLLLLASYAHPDGTHAEMSLSTIAREAGLSRRQVNTIVHFLAETGYVHLESAAGAHGTNRYAVQRPWLKQGNDFPSATTSLGAITAPLGQPLPTIDKENKDLKEQSCEAIALGKKLPYVVGQSLPQETKGYDRQVATTQGITVTEKAAHLVSSWVSPAFSQVLQGKDPAPSDSPPPAVDAPLQEPAPLRAPRKFPFDVKRFALGDPCPDDPTHRYGDTGKSLRFIEKGTCRLCTLAARKTASSPP